MSRAIHQRDSMPAMVGETAPPSPLRPVAERIVERDRERGEALPASTQELMQERFGVDFAGVRVHADQLAGRSTAAFGANAFTVGNDIFFDAGKYNPHSLDGQRLLAHELTHVVQQEASRTVQFDLMESLPTALGGFEIELATRGAPAKSGMEGHIRFLPAPSGPYSAQIALLQIADVTDVGGSTTTPGSPVDWTKVGAGEESGRMDLMTTGLDGAPPGWFIDTITATAARGSARGPEYLAPYGESVGNNEYGWLRSPTDVKNASLYDYPGTSGATDLDLDFETAAKATDTQTVYGSLHWGFQLRSSVVRNEYAFAEDAQSSVFDEALERFRGYYTHEPVVIYFDTNIDVPMTGEDSKIVDCLDYLRRYPDVRLLIEGYADERGSLSLNLGLSRRRAQNVRSLAVSLGIDPARIDPVLAHGETTAFAAGSNPGTWRANRRVVISFQRTACTPIVMP